MWNFWFESSAADFWKLVTESQNKWFIHVMRLNKSSKNNNLGYVQYLFSQFWCWCFQSWPVLWIILRHKVWNWKKRLCSCLGLFPLDVITQPFYPTMKMNLKSYWHNKGRHPTGHSWPVAITPSILAGQCASDQVELQPTVKIPQAAADLGHVCVDMEESHMAPMESQTWLCNAAQLVRSGVD